MRHLRRFLACLAADSSGVTALEYGLIAAVIGGVVISAATSFGGSLTSAYSTIGSSLVSTAGTM